MPLLRGTIRAYDDATHTATVQLQGSAARFHAGIPVASHIPPPLLAPGLGCAVAAFDDQNPDNTLLIAVYGQPVDQFVDAAGDTMTGQLSIQGAGVRPVLANNSFAPGDPGYLYPDGLTMFVVNQAGLGWPHQNGIVLSWKFSDFAFTQWFSQGTHLGPGLWVRNWHGNGDVGTNTWSAFTTVV